MSWMADVGSIVDLQRRLEALEARVDRLERDPPRRVAHRPAAAETHARTWTRPYDAAQLTVSETWIELHEHSARPQLQRLIREVVEVEGPVVSRLALDRIRRAWGLRRAGGRVQDAFDQAVRQLVARALVEVREDALAVPGRELDIVRVPGPGDDTQRAADDVPMVELRLALERLGAEMPGAGQDAVTAAAARLFGWTRRGASIQERLDRAARVGPAG